MAQIIFLDRKALYKYHYLDLRILQGLAFTGTPQFYSCIEL